MNKNLFNIEEIKESSINATYPYSVREVAKILRVDAHYVYELTSKGLLKSIKCKHTKIAGIWLIEFLQQYEGYDLSNLDDIKPIRRE